MSKAVTAAIAGGICMSLGLAPLFIGTFPLFLQPVSNELGWGAAIYPQSALVSGAASALIGPVVGHLIDRFGVRPLMFIGLVSWAGCLTGFSTMNGSQFQMLAWSVLMGVTASTCGPIAVAKVVAGWFDRHRGFALAIVLSAAPAITTAIMVVAAGRLIDAYGWRATYQVFAAGVIVIGLPVAFFFLREAQAAEHPCGAVMDAREGRTAREALHSREFWLIVLLTGLVCAVVQSMISHFVAFSAERGVTLATATVALSTFSLVGPAGPLLAGALADRARGPKPLVVFYLLPLLGLLLLGFGPAMVIPAMVLLGVGFLAASGMLPYLLTRYFGVRYASQLFGLGLGIVTLSMGFGPVILGFARDRLNAFAATIPMLVVLLAGAILTVLILPGYQQSSPPKDEQAGRRGLTPTPSE